MSRLRRQRGVAMLLVVAAIAIGTTWMVVSRLNAASNDILIAKREHNARVLARAKQALIGYVAAQAIKYLENNPGSLPCPEDLANYNATNGNDGKMGINCAGTVRVGRFPWRTLGLEKLVDADGEALWYVVSPNWSYDTGTNSSINSNSAGQLTVDGVANSAIALIFAPGAAFNVAASTGCAAREQTRPATGTPDWRDYLECENATSPADYAFVTTGASGSFNDQVITLTAAEMLPALEAAIASRIEREIAPVLKSVYASSDWGSGVSTTKPAYPFAAPFGNPGTSNYQGSAATYAGLLPFSYQPSGSCGSDARCTSTLHAWGAAPTFTRTGGSTSLYASQTCNTTQQTIGGTTYDQMHCYAWWYDGWISLQYDDRISNVASALRTFTLSHYTTVLPPTLSTYRWNGSAYVSTGSVTPTQSRRFNADGSFSFVLNATMPTVSGNWGMVEFYTTRPAFSDHALLSSSDATTGWFVRNKWYELAYYAVAQGHTGTNTPACTTSVNCVSVTNLTPSGAQHAVLILAGRSMSGQTRPSSVLANYLEGGNATGAYIKQAFQNRVSFNDRVVAVSSN